MNETPTLDEIVGTVGRLYSSHGLSPPYGLRRAAAGWTGIPLAKILAAIDLHFLYHSRLYSSGSGDAYFHLVQRAVSDLRDKHSHTEDARRRPSAQRGVARNSSRPQRPAVLKLHRGAGYVEAFVDDEGELPSYARPGAVQPQPFSSQQARPVKWEGLGEDDDPEDM